jgi:hypothetical protein
MPERPWARPSQRAATVVPRGETAPLPVTTTRVSDDMRGYSLAL